MKETNTTINDQQVNNVSGKGKTNEDAISLPRDGKASTAQESVGSTTL